MNATIEQRVRIHGLALLAIFPNATVRDPVNLCRKLRRIEAIGHKLAEDRCNLDMSEAVQTRRSEGVYNSLAKLLGKHEVPIFANMDPRGYCLKIESEWASKHAPHLYRDWGGYGIIAPDLRED